MSACRRRNWFVGGSAKLHCTPAQEWLQNGQIQIFENISYETKITIFTFLQDWKQKLALLWGEALCVFLFIWIYVWLKKNLLHILVLNYMGKAFCNFLFVCICFYYSIHKVTNKCICFHLLYKQMLLWCFFFEWYNSYFFALSLFYTVLEEVIRAIRCSKMFITW